ncbi:MAG: hypothetical protein ACRD1C_01940 [Terriglobales bacterium]
MTDRHHTESPAPTATKPAPDERAGVPAAPLLLKIGFLAFAVLLVYLLVRASRPASEGWDPLGTGAPGAAGDFASWQPAS